MNINDQVIVRLTPDGERLWAEAWNKYSDNGGKVPRAIEIQARQPDGSVRFQMHELMHIFGPVCTNGSRQLPFVNNEIKISEEPDGRAKGKV